MPDPANLTPDTEHTIVVPIQLPPWNKDNFTLHTPGGPRIPVAVLSCQLGVEGFHATVRIQHAP